MGKIFGTFGVRGIYHEGMDEDFAMRMGKAFATFLKRTSHRPKVAVGRDTRKSGETLMMAFISGLVSCGVDVVDLGILPTPLVQFSTRRMDVDGGAVITASHNPPQYNGIKLLEENGMGLSRDNEFVVEEIFEKGEFSEVSWRDIGRVEKRDTKWDYFAEVLRKVDVEALKRRQPIVIADEAGGAGALILPELLEILGCRVISVNAHTSGFFSARDPEPSEENLGYLKEIVRSLKPDLAVAQDGDADRAVFLKENGEFVHGDRTFALVEKMILSEKKGPVVTTVATSNVISDIARQFGVEVHITKVGDLVVTGKLLEVNGVVGGEENGGVIFPDMTLGRDGIFTTVKILEAISRYGKGFSTLLSELPLYHQLKRKVRCEGDRKEAVRQFARIMKEKGYTVDETDGAKVLVDDGWVLVRASGTEPIIRIFSESKEKGRERELYEMAVSELRKICEVVED